MKHNQKIKIKRVSVFFARIPSLVYGITYIFLIPLFAVVYFLMPFDFYHTTVQYEKSLNSDSISILGDIKNTLIKDCTTSYGGTNVNLGSWNVDITNIEVDSLTLYVFSKPFKGLYIN